MKQEQNLNLAKEVEQIKTKHGLLNEQFDEKLREAVQWHTNAFAERQVKLESTVLRQE